MMMTTNPSLLHRLLDEAFAGAPLTADAQDLKEELRSSLIERVSELTRQGLSDAEASRRAMDELGDVREAIGAVTDASVPSSSVGSGVPARVDAAQAWEANKVRPRPAFVLRAVVYSIVIACGLVALWIAFPLLEADSSGVVVVVGVLTVALPLGLLVADSLRQETTTNYPVPRRRATLYGTSYAAIIAGLVLLTWFAITMAAVWVPFVGLILAIGGVLGAIYAGITQTNRKKAWVRSARAGFEAGDAFTNNPNAAARFGIYSGALWVFAIAAFIGLAITEGFGWAWAVFIVAVIVQMIMLARMLFREATPRD